MVLKIQRTILLLNSLYLIVSQIEAEFDPPYAATPILEKAIDELSKIRKELISKSSNFIE